MFWMMSLLLWRQKRLLPRAREWRWRPRPSRVLRSWLLPWPGSLLQPPYVSSKKALSFTRQKNASWLSVCGVRGTAGRCGVDATVWVGFTIDVCTSYLTLRSARGGDIWRKPQGYTAPQLRFATLRFGGAISGAARNSATLRCSLRSASCWVRRVGRALRSGGGDIYS